MSMQNFWCDLQLDFLHFQGSLKDFMEQQGEEVTFENTVGIDLLQDCVLRDDIFTFLKRVEFS